MTRNIDLDSITSSNSTEILVHVLDTLRTGATFGERHLLEEFGFIEENSYENKKICSHFIGKFFNTRIIKFSTSGSQPYWAIIKGNNETTILPGYVFYESKFDNNKFDIYLKELKEGFEKIGFTYTTS